MARSLRLAYGEKLAELGAKYPDFFVFDADLSESTQTALFGKVFPERHFNMGVAENNMVLYAAGSSRILPLVFASSFAMFLTGRAWEIVRNSVAHDSLNVKLVATHAGISVGEDGSSHQIIEDIAIMRAIPKMKVFCPADYTETKLVIQHAVDNPGPMYIRLSRSTSEDVFSENYRFKEGAGVFLSQKKGSCGLLVTTGLLTAIGQKALENLEKTGKGFIDHIHFPTLKPLDVSILLPHLSTYRFIATFEEHNIIGGLGDAFLGAIATLTHPPVYKFGIPDIFGRSGKANDLWELFELDAESVTQKLYKLLKEKDD